MQEFDHVIVGAGSAGSVLAARLSEDPAVRVALVEAGGPDTDPDFRIPMGSMALLGSSHDWGYRTTAQPGLDDRRIDWPRGKVLGGSSSTNFQMWIPGHRLDYDEWGRAAGPQWSWDAVRPYFRKAERWTGPPEDGTTYGDAGPLRISPPRDPDPTTAHFLRACEELGLKPVPGGLGGPDHTGSAVTPLNQWRGARWSTADGYLRPAANRPNLTVFTGKQVHRVLLEGGRATGVEFADGRLTALREVILCAGAVNSPQLLMLSGIGDAQALREVGIEPRIHLPGVGRNLQDHIALDIVMKAVEPVRLAHADTPAARRRYEEERLGPLTSNVAEAVAFFRADGGPGAPDLELIWAPVAFTEDEPSGADGLTAAVVLLQPESRGRLTLTDADPTSPPRIDPRYLSAGADVRRLMAGARFAERIFGTEALRPLVSGPWAPWARGLSDSALAALVRAQASTLFHPVGTCRMGGGEDDLAVVDAHLRVRGVDALRVVDASVLPNVPRGHTHAPCVMLGERAADLIRDGQPAGGSK
ncbi:GMC family oxidoreductase N-terminal domain-containing protein [Streptomyces sp. ISL-87]|nr:GMC family oxidoreductase N-terminal domain-containing protein [Streptomyces sp. ISL-21]MBT2608423.1 GMC family oxidoreductase N-terminal domain-containing protein [Streptomyces sp. ISL-87]